MKSISLTQAIDELSLIQHNCAPVLSPAQQLALDYAKEALRTIEDGNFILKGVNDNATD